MFKTFGEHYQNEKYAGTTQRATERTNITETSMSIMSVTVM